LAVPCLQRPRSSSPVCSGVSMERTPVSGPPAPAVSFPRVPISRSPSPVGSVALAPGRPSRSPSPVAAPIAPASQADQPVLVKIRDSPPRRVSPGSTVQRSHWRLMKKQIG
jgi:hypothetical protein